MQLDEILRYGFIRELFPYDFQCGASSNPLIVTQCSRLMHKLTRLIFRIMRNFKSKFPFVLGSNHRIFALLHGPSGTSLNFYVSLRKIIIALLSRLCNPKSNYNKQLSQFPS